jgi:hypothetical protein
MLGIVFQVHSSFLTIMSKTDKLYGMTSSLLCFAQEVANYPTKHDI